MSDATQGDQTQLRDELEIRKLVARYSDAVARSDADAWGATWAEDGEWLIMGQPTKGRDQVVALWKNLMAGFSFVVQLSSGGIIEIQGPRASGRWYITEQGQGLDGTATLTIGVYNDEYCRVGDEWRFLRRRFDPLYMGPPDLTAKPFPLPEQV
jgi:hypothetical protein